MEGGCILTDDEEMYHILLSIRAHGWTRNLPKRNHVSGIKSDDDFDESFKFVLPGYNVRPLEMSGAIGLEQLKKLPSFIENRRKNAAYLKNKLQNHPFIDLQKEIGQSSWFGFSIVLNEKSPYSRKEFIKVLNKNKLVKFKLIGNPVVHTDEFLGETVIYRDSLDLKMLDQNEQNLMSYEVIFQGCAEKRFCYTPIKVKLSSLQVL